MLRSLMLPEFRAAVVVAILREETKHDKMHSMQRNKYLEIGPNQNPNGHPCGHQKHPGKHFRITLVRRLHALAAEAGVL